MRKVVMLIMAIVLSTSHLWAQERTITGKVTDDKGTPISGASIFIKGTKTGTITKSDGTYSISVPANAKSLVFSSVNMVEKELAITDQNAVDVSLSSDEKSLSEVVITGYTRESRRGFAGWP